MTLLFIRIFFAIISSVVGYQIGLMFEAFNQYWPLAGLAGGLFIALITVLNTLGMIMLLKEIDIFSVSARIFFFSLGIFLITISSIDEKNKNT